MLLSRKEFSEIVRDLNRHVLGTRVDFLEVASRRGQEGTNAGEV